MTHTFKLARRTARLRVLLLASLTFTFAGCDSADPFTSDNIAPDSPEATDQTSMIEPDTPLEEDGEFAPAPGGNVSAAPQGLSLATSFAGGIPMGLFHIPYEDLGSTYNGVLRCIYPRYLLSTLKTVKAHGGKVVISMGCSEKNYKDADGNFSLSKWKAKVDAFKGIDFSSYINDGTVIGHYMIDEPHDPSNWNGKTVPQSTLEAMAKYSKHYWPNMPTIVRSWPDYLDNYSGTYYYLDAAWAQYSARKGDPSSFISSNVSKAKAKGLALIVGLNLIHGGTGGTQMTASQVKSWGSTLLSSSYPCAFLSWRYYDWYLTSTMQSAMKYLRDKAQNRSSKSCRGA